MINLGRYYRKAYKKNTSLTLFETKKGAQLDRALKKERDDGQGALGPCDADGDFTSLNSHQRPPVNRSDGGVGSIGRLADATATTGVSMGPPLFLDPCIFVPISSTSPFPAVAIPSPATAPRVTISKKVSLLTVGAGLEIEQEEEELEYDFGDGGGGGRIGTMGTELDSASSPRLAGIHADAPQETATAHTKVRTCCRTMHVVYGS